jgi:hypothetical protein
MDKPDIDLSELLETDVSTEPDPALITGAHRLMRAIDQLDDSHQERVEELQQRRHAS